MRLQRLVCRLTLLLIVAALPTPAVADDWQDCKRHDSSRRIEACSQIIDGGAKGEKNLALAYLNRGLAHKAKGELARAIADYTEAIRIVPSYAVAFSNRGNAFAETEDYDRAVTDHNEAIRLNPRSAVARNNRGWSYYKKGDLDRAIADYAQAIRIDPRYTLAYNNRGAAYRAKGEIERAIADYTQAIGINAKYAVAYTNRGNAFAAKGEHDRAFADYDEAIRLDPRSAVARNNRGWAYHFKRERDRAIADFSEAIRIDPKYAVAYSNRGIAHAAKGEIAAAIADYRKVLELPATTAADRQRQDIARERIARLSQPAGTPNASPGRRVALVIGNANYAHAQRLANPMSDARAIAAALRRLGFATVVERYDVGREAMGQALKQFGDFAQGAEWAVVFFAGHGLEVNGTTFLVPTDAALKRDTHVLDEAISLNHVQAKADAASKLGLIILDACRNNPFLAPMARTAGGARSIGSGLAPVEPEGNMLVAYAAKHGTIAEDGLGEHSPFTEALLRNIEEPGLEINFLFRRVRDQVREKTARRQEPFLYGSLGSEPLFFKRATVP